MSTISAGNTLTTGFISSSDTTGNLVFQTNGTTTALTLSTSQNATLANNASVVGSVTSVNTFGFKNRLINGGMVIDQRNAGASVTQGTTGTQYCLDRWLILGTQASKFTVQQNAGSVTPPVGYSNYLGCTSSSAYSVTSTDYFGIQQRIEGFNTADLAWGTANAKTVTLSFQVYSSLTGTFGGVITNSAYNYSYPFTYTISSANTWTSISVTIAGPTTGTWVGATNGTGLVALFGIGVGSTYNGTAGSWSANTYFSATGATSVVGTSGATFYITGVQLEVGSQATSFDFRSYPTEFAMCQRYYETSGILSGCVVGMYSTASGYGGYYYKATKRTVPTITTSAIGNFTVYCASATFGVASFGSTAQIAMCTLGVNLATTVPSNGYAASVSSTDANSLMFSAEL